MNIVKTVALVIAIMVFAACLSACSGESSDESSSPYGMRPISSVAPSSIIVPPKEDTHKGSTHKDDVSSVSTPERDWGKWSLIRLDYLHTEGGKSVLDGRYEGDGILTIDGPDYDLEFTYPDGKIALKSSGTFTTGAQATFIGTSTISDYPVAMFGGFGLPVVMKFTDDAQSREIVITGTKL